MTLKSRTFLITGANAGIGFAAAQRLAQAGATVIMACRSLERGEEARKKIIHNTGGGAIHLLQVDLASQPSIRAFAEQVQARFERLDALINNAANFDISKRQPNFTGSGAEEIFATNHLGPFLLTHLLLDLLKRSAPARVVNISSKGLLLYPSLKIQFDDLTTSRERRYSPQYAYYHSKLAQVMFTRELAKRLTGTGVTANIIRVPNVRLDISRYPDVHPLLLKLYDIKQRFAITPEQMAETYMKVASAPEYEGVNGTHLDEKGEPAGVSKFARREGACARLWQVSVELTGIEVHAPDRLQDLLQ
jgi:NAD(P)-dependent dehydrogenase (short-subunit alcohol dehydrogenase family)